MKKLVCIPVIIMYIWFMKTIYIYEIVNPISGLPFYIGQTTDPKTRFKEHKFKKYSSNREKRKIVEQIKEHGLLPVFNILHTLTDQVQADAIESKLIEAYSKKHKLVNVFACGKIGLAHTRKKKFNPDPKLSAASTCKKSVAMLDTDGNIISIFESIRHAATETGISNASIASITRGETRRKTAGGYVWKYI